MTDRFAGFEAQSLNVHVDFPLFQRTALPVMAGKTKIAGIKIHDTRMMRLMEVLLHGGTQLNGWRSADIHRAALTTFGLPVSTYTLTQIRYDLRKMNAHGLLERIGRSYSYCLTEKGTKAALMSILFHKRICGPLANSLFQNRPNEALKPPARSKLPTTRPIMQFNTFSTYSLRENSERSILKPAGAPSSVSPVRRLFISNGGAGRTDLWDDLASTPEVVPMHDWQKLELARRKANLLKNPASGLSWEEVKQRVRTRYGR